MILKDFPAKVINNYQIDDNTIEMVNKLATLVGAPHIKRLLYLQTNYETGAT